MASPNDLLNRALALLNKGKHSQAKALCKKCLHQQPDNFNALHLYGVVCLNQADFDTAVSYLERACQQSAAPRALAQAFNNLSVAELNRGQLDAAMTAVEQAIARDGEQLAFLANRANIHELRQQWPAMAADLQRAVELDPTDDSLHTGLALALRQQQDYEPALTLLEPFLAHASPSLELCWEALLLIGLIQGPAAMQQQAVSLSYRLQRDPGFWLEQLGDYLCEQHHEALAIEPYQQSLALAVASRPELAHKLAALRGERPEQAPSGYVEQLYQTHALQFERRLVGKLGYRAPWLLADWLQQLGSKRFGRVIDLGCGSGLAGQQLRGKFEVDMLIGVDLASEMLTLAEAKGCYDQLENAELIAYLQQQPNAESSLVCALDVLIYNGNLNPIFEQASRVLGTTGLFAFSVELLSECSKGSPTIEADFSLHSSGTLPAQQKLYRTTSQTVRFHCRKVRADSAPPRAATAS